MAGIFSPGDLMPWTANDAGRHTKKAVSPTAKRQWSNVANSVLARTGNEGRAVASANATVSRRSSAASRSKFGLEAR